jgi:hypothetical protein
MQFVKMTLDFRPGGSSRRQFLMNFCLKFKTQFYYDSDWLKWGFWFPREGSPGEGVHKVEFRDWFTEELIQVLERSDMPNTLYGNPSLPRCKVFGLGHTIRYSFNIGRPVYRTFPCALSPQNTKPNGSDSLVTRSSYSEGSYNNYWKPRMDTYFSWCLNPNADLNIVQGEHRDRHCVSVDWVGVNIERRFKWV